MRIALSSLTAAALFASALGALAASTMTTGTIKSFVLNDGTAYSLPTGYKDPGLKAGKKVELGWHMQDSRHVADTVKLMN
ncbi:DUF1344 domain-containing protein [Hoeflea olei]|uniref:DUF1344 domain-containing protein n=1 Tax=Hoeflea olei TaxID=1480615 RepID=A0A1C1YTH7_9HYPH|nr:DUF1344 domain-containing protein [Hoeflea olei]OCW56687.1 hypothetical protein AWJ14_17305 [Hoeflea olei]